MRSFGDYIEKLNGQHLMIFPDDRLSPDDTINDDHVILLITHDFTRTGGPSVLLDAAKVMKDLGYSLFILSAWEGELLPDYMALGCTVILYPSYQTDLPWMHSLTELFTVIFANTLLTLPAVWALAKDTKQLFWWLHESAFAFLEKLKNIEFHENAPHYLAAGTPVVDSVRKFFGAEAQLFPFCTWDVLHRYPRTGSANSDVVSFLHVGTVDKNKGQILLLNAIRALPKTVLQHTDFTFVANLTKSTDMKIYHELKSVEEAYPNVHVLDGMPKETLYQYYADADVVIVSSYQETTSAVAVETLMMEKLLICSDSAGICHYLCDGENAFLFRAGDVHSLQQAIEAVVTSENDFSSFRTAGRQIYLENYSTDAFQKRLIRLLQPSA